MAERKPASRRDVYLAVGLVVTLLGDGGAGWIGVAILWYAWIVMDK